MRLKELISKLEELESRYGDVEVMGYSDMAAEVFPVQRVEDIFCKREEVLGDEEMIEGFPENTLFVTCL